MLNLDLFTFAGLAAVAVVTVALFAVCKFSNCE